MIEMSSPQTYLPRHLVYDGPSPYEKGKWVPERRGAISPRAPVPRYRSQIERPETILEDDPPITARRVESRPYTQHEAPVPTSEDILNPKLKGGTKTRKSKKSKRQSRSKLPNTEVPKADAPPKPLLSFLSFLPRIFFCCISTRPSYTQIQHLVIPTSQVCISTRPLQFLQSLPRQEFLILNYMVQEVFTDDGVKVLGRIPDYDFLIENALKGQIRTAKRPWTAKEREGYVEHTAGLYARLLRKLETYEKAPMCEVVYGKKIERKWWSIR
ncbi:hypothetical protein TWF718_010344 [Orbilia javanica]|uniref:Uncharacterized protein n=1 Tax=Orbilia javanica TaxID=47235 RepID=A0AAN8MS94_9PEZI